MRELIVFINQIVELVSQNQSDKEIGKDKQYRIDNSILFKVWIEIIQSHHEEDDWDNGHRNIIKIISVYAHVVDVRQPFNES